MFVARGVVCNYAFILISLHLIEWMRDHRLLEAGIWLGELWTRQICWIGMRSKLWLHASVIPWLKIRAKDWHKNDALNLLSLHMVWEKVYGLEIKFDK